VLCRVSHASRGGTSDSLVLQVPQGVLSGEVHGVTADGVERGREPEVPNGERGDLDVGLSTSVSHHILRALVGHPPCCDWVMMLLELPEMLGSRGTVDLLGPFELRQNSGCKRRLVARRPHCFQGS
jgi:hypothetical protein